MGSYEYPFAGKLIDGRESYSWIRNALSNLNGEALLCGAFLKTNILEAFHNFSPEGSKARVLARWQVGDLIAKASDFEAYEKCKEFGWEFHIKLNFHGKVFFIPDSGALVGSANPTSSGFGLNRNSNVELGTIVEANESNISIIKNLFTDSILMTDDIYGQLKDFINLSNIVNSEKLSWPRNILDIIDKTDYPSERLFLSECLLSNGENIFHGFIDNSEDVLSDLSLLGLLGFDITKTKAIQQFLTTKIFKWTYSTVKINNGALNFGGVTAALHNAMLEDPLPYRSEVKKLVQNIYSWIDLAGVENTGIEVSKPNYSQILKIV